MNCLTFKDLAEEWIQFQKNFIKESTYCTYAVQMQNHIIPLLGHLECAKITSDELQDALLQWFGRNRLQGNIPLSEKTVRDIIAILKSCLNYGIHKGYLSCKEINISLPINKKTNTKVKTYNVREQQIIIDAILSNLNSQSNGILICLFTGIRIGELCALKWSDIDLSNKTITVSKTLQRLYFKDADGKNYTKVIISSPKTHNSIREIPISTKLIQTLKKLHINNPEAYILTNSEKYIEPRTYRKFYSNFMNTLDIQQLKFHSLRHTFATQCIESGADYKSVSEILGHSNVNITMNLYVHPSIEQKRRCVELMDRINSSDNP